MSDPITHLLLPEEIVEQIILKLPSKPLILFKSLSKTWLSLISTPQFLAKHLLPDRRDDGKLLLVKRRHKTNTRDHVFSLLSHHKLTPIRLLPYPEPEELSPPTSPQIHISGPWVLPYPDLPLNPSFPRYLGADVGILGPCNDLVCLFDAEHHYIILRSSFAGEELKILPDSDVPDPPGYEARGPVLDSATTTIQMIIRLSGSAILKRLATNMGLCPTRPSYRKVEIYSFNADRWKGNYTGEFRFDIVGNLTDPAVAYVDGVMMWLACKSNVQGCIIWFRMSDESIGETLLPSDAEIDRFHPAGERRLEFGPWWKRYLFLMNDKTVAVVVYDILLGRVDTCFHVWVLLQFGVEDSWTRLFTVGPLTGIQRPLWFWNTGTMIMETGECGLVFNNPFTKEMAPLNICGHEMTLQIISIEERYIL